MVNRVQNLNFLLLGKKVRKANIARGSLKKVRLRILFKLYQICTTLNCETNKNLLRNYFVDYLSFLFQGFKGAVSVRMKIYGVSICFVNCHLCAHDHMLPVRIKEYNTIVETHNFSEEDTPKILYHE